MPNKVSFFFIILMILCISCDNDYVFDEYKTVSTQWNKNQEIQFVYPSQDTINPYNLFINLRNDNSYKFSNLFLIVEMNYPHGKTVTDTLEYKMAKPDGTFLGDGFSDIKENKLWYKGYDKPFVFSEKGRYIINIQHAMRENGKTKGVENLTGILDIGFRVEKLLQ